MIMVHPLTRIPRARRLIAAVAGRLKESQVPNRYPKQRHRRRRYAIDEMAKLYLSSMANKAHFEEVCALHMQQASHGKVRLLPGWRSRILADLIFPPPPIYASEQPEPPAPGPEAPKSRGKPRPVMLCVDLFDRIVRAQGGCCYLCGWLFCADKRATREHVVPVALDGKNAANILAACPRCNGAKADRMPHPCEVIYLAAVNARLAKDAYRSRARRTPQTMANDPRPSPHNSRV